MAEKRKKTARSTKRKTPKVKLASGNVMVLTVVICLLCALVLSVSIFLNSGAQEAEPEETVDKKDLIAQQENRIEGPLQPKHQNESAIATPKKNSEKPVHQPVRESVSAPGKDVAKEVAAPKRAEPKIEKKIEPKPEPKVVPKPVAKVAKVDPVQPQVPKDPFNIPPARNGATVVFVIDDAGRSAANVKRYTSLLMPITIAVLPKLPETKACAAAIRASGKEMILHQPMQAMNLNISPGPGAISAENSTWEIAEIVKENLAELGPGVKGLNNHEGSLITSNQIKIGAVLDVCKERGIYFLDSRTTAETKARYAANERGMDIFEKSGPYIDNETKRASELKRILESLEHANKTGRAIVIGHVDKSVEILPELLTEMYPFMVKAGYRFATPSTLK